MPEIKAAVEAATARIHELAEEIAHVRELLVDERDARVRDRNETDRRVAEAKIEAEEKMEAARLKVRTGHRRLITAVMILALLLAGSVFTLARVLHENELDRCERSNEARRGQRIVTALMLEGDRDVADIFIDEFEAAPRNQTPEAEAYLAGRRALIERRQQERAEEVTETLDEFAPIVDC